MNWAFPPGIFLPFKIVPIAILVIVAGVVAILGLVTRAGGRRYASGIVELALGAACATWVSLRLTALLLPGFSRVLARRPRGGRWFSTRRQVTGRRLADGTEPGARLTSCLASFLSYRVLRALGGSHRPLRHTIGIRSTSPLTRGWFRGPELM